MSTDREVEWKQEGETSKCSVQWRKARINNHIIKRKDSVTQVKNRFCICSSSGPVWMIFIDRWCQIKLSLGFKFLTYLLTNHTCTSWCFFGSNSPWRSRPFQSGASSILGCITMVVGLWCSLAIKARRQWDTHSDGAVQSTQINMANGGEPLNVVFCFSFEKHFPEAAYLTFKQECGRDSRAGGGSVSLACKQSTRCGLHGVKGDVHTHFELAGSCKPHCVWVS